MTELECVKFWHHGLFNYFLGYFSIVIQMNGTVIGNMSRSKTLKLTQSSRSFDTADLYLLGLLGIRYNGLK